MNAFYGIVGGSIVFALSALVVWIAVMGICGLVEALWCRHDITVKMQARSEAGRALKADAWWFSEHPPTMELIREIAANLQEGRGILDVSPARERWRERMAVLSAASRE